METKAEKKTDPLKCCSVEHKLDMTSLQTSVFPSFHLDPVRLPLYIQLLPLSFHFPSSSFSMLTTSFILLLILVSFPSLLYLTIPSSPFPFFFLIASAAANCVPAHLNPTPPSPLYPVFLFPILLLSLASEPPPRLPPSLPFLFPSPGPPSVSTFAFRYFFFPCCFR